MQPVYLLLRPAKTEEVTPEAQVGLLSSFLNIGKYSFADKVFLKRPKCLSLEIGSTEQKTHFFLVVEPELKSYLTSQVLSQYPKTLVHEEKQDPLFKVVKGKKTALASLSVAHGSNYPIKTFKQFSEAPPLSAIIGFLSKLTQGESAYIQILLRVPYSQDSMQKKIRSAMKTIDIEGKEKSNPYAKLIQEKLSTPLLISQIRLVFSSERTNVVNRLAELAGSFGIYTLSEGNSFMYKRRTGHWRKAFFQNILKREFSWQQPSLYLNLEEAASLWHLPDKRLSQIKAVHWGKTLISEAPDELPVAIDYKDKPKEKREINFFAKTEWKNQEEIFGIQREDRHKHIYIIGKTGAGKSTLIANMAINDIRNGEGVAVIDPHGDLSEMILDYIPKRRLTDVIYLDPTLSEERAFSLNLFDKEGAEHIDVVASGIVSVFYKLYGDSWGPRLEYILRNTIITLLVYGKATFADILRLLADKKYRDRVVEAIREKDPVMANYWITEYNRMTDRLRIESIFISSTTSH